MKKTILAFALLLVATITQAQNSLFTNISTTDQYQEYWTVYDESGDGVYTATDKRFPVSFQTEYLATGEGYKIEVVIEEEGNNKGVVQHRYNAVDNYYLASGYPFESVLKHKYKKDGFVSIGDYVLLLAGISDDNTSFKGIEKIYIKKGTATPSKEAEKVQEPKKKKMSFKEKMKALKSKAGGISSGNSGIKIKDLRKNITDYLVAMKAKQDARTSAELKGDKNIIAARDRGDADLKKYNDSIKATPEYKRTMAFHKKRAGEKVTIRNETGRIIYVFEKGDDRTFSGTELWDNGSTDKECDGDYSYSFSKKGSGTQCYTANTACGSQVIVN
ncbi:hypothetical protein [Lacinutrix sp. MEBiC02595]